MNAIHKIIGDRVLIRRVKTNGGVRIVLPEKIDDQEKFYMAEVVAVGNALSEPIRPRSLIMVQRCGNQEVVIGGKKLELISTLDVVAKFE
jgi:co-chaperonin GroES (HSP10)